MRSGPGRVGGCYTLIRVLGRGAFGVVWLGRHDVLHNLVAIKVFDPDPSLGALSAAARADLETRFTREARVGALLGRATRNVIRALDAGVDGDLRYLVMELAEGPTLEELLAERGRLQPGDVIALVRQLADALDALHATGFVHRDLKPSNVVCVRRAPLAIKLGDFGVVRDVGRNASARRTAEGLLVGTPATMSPEQIRGAADVGPASDLWSLAVVAYEALVGTAPFEGRDLQALADAICLGVAEPPSWRAPLPPAVDGFFARAFSVDPAGRFASAAELAAALEDALGDADLPAAAQPPRTQPSSPPSARRPRRASVRRGVAAALAALAALAAATGARALPSPTSDSLRLAVAVVAVVERAAVEVAARAADDGSPKVRPLRGAPPPATHAPAVVDPRDEGATPRRGVDPARPQARVARLAAVGGGSDPPPIVEPAARVDVLMGEPAVGAGDASAIF